VAYAHEYEMRPAASSKAPVPEFPVRIWRAALLQCRSP